MKNKQSIQLAVGNDKTIETQAANWFTILQQPAADQKTQLGKDFDTWLTIGPRLKLA